MCGQSPPFFPQACVLVIVLQSTGGPFNSFDIFSFSHFVTIIRGEKRGSSFPYLLFVVTGTFYHTSPCPPPNVQSYCIADRQTFFRYRIIGIRRGFILDTPAPVFSFFFSLSSLFGCLQLRFKDDTVTSLFLRFLLL